MNLGDEYSEHLATRFVDAHRLRDGEHSKANERVAAARPVPRQGAGRLCPRRPRRARSHRHVETSGPGGHEEMAERVRAVLPAIDAIFEPSTLHGRMRTIAVFLDDLGSRNITTLDQLQPADIAAFVASRRRLCPRSMSADRFRRALLSAVPSAARNPAAGPQPGAADGPGPAGCHDPIGVGARNSLTGFSRWSIAAPPEASATTPSSCSHVAWDCDWAISER